MPDVLSSQTASGPRDTGIEAPRRARSDGIIPDKLTTAVPHEELKGMSCGQTWWCAVSCRRRGGEPRKWLSEWPRIAAQQELRPPKTAQRRPPGGRGSCRAANLRGRGSRQAANLGRARLLPSRGIQQPGSSSAQRELRPPEGSTPLASQSATAHRISR
jgi:hypothetical protein